MIETKEYIVSLNEGVDYNTFWHEIETNGSGSMYVPGRAVDIVNARPLSQRSCHYALTDEEAEKLRNDPRVYCVEIPVEQRDDIEIVPFITQTGLYYKTPNTGNNPDNTLGINWGLFRLNSRTNNTVGNSGTLNYNYSLDGTGVDFVIQDSGLQCDHPEFQDVNGVSRVQKINWWTEAGGTGNPPWYPDIGEYGMPVGFYKDTFGHGTHCAGIAAGKTYGRAKNSRIYVMKIPLSGSGTGGVSTTYAFDLITAWHARKPVDPVTGYKRPTVVNMSWGSTATFTNITGGNYQGTPWTGTSKQPQYGMIGNSTNVFGKQFGPFDVDVSQMLAAGIIICGAAGNYYQTVDVPGGVNYNNYFTSSVAVPGYPAGTPLYYMRGGSPGCSPGVITVGNVGYYDSTTTPIGAQQKYTSSESGPRVDVWAPGHQIVSSMPNTNALSCTARYPYNTSFLIGSLTGTSMASPQVAGLCAQLLQLYPTYTPEQIRNKVIADSELNVLYTTGSSSDYSVSYSLHGGPNRYAYQPIQGLATVKDSAGQWKPVHNIEVKTGANTWTKVKTVWAKTVSGWVSTH